MGIPELTHLSLFSGIGGIDLAAEWAGFQTIAMVEKDTFCQKVLAKNFPGVPIHNDIKTFDGRPSQNCTFLSAGWPCQPHSQSGQRKASKDERDLWPDTVRILGEVKPKWFVGENVSGLLTAESGRFFGQILSDLAELGYSVGWACYGAKDVGACHIRNRLFIVARNVTNADPLGSPWSATDRIGEEMGVQIPQPSGNDTDRISKRPHPLRSESWRQWGISPVIVKSSFRRERHGVSKWVDRLKSLGNSVVPHQIYPVLLAIRKEIENDSQYS